MPRPLCSLHNKVQGLQKEPFDLCVARLLYYVARLPCTTTPNCMQAL